MAKLPQEILELGWYIKWGAISKNYFGLSRSWIYQRLGGYDGNGNKCEFTDSQKETLRNSLKDLAKKISDAAEQL